MQIRWRCKKGILNKTLEAVSKNKDTHKHTQTKRLLQSNLEFWLRKKKKQKFALHKLNKKTYFLDARYRCYYPKAG